MKNLSNRFLITSLFLLLSTSFVYSQWNAGQPQIDHTTFNLSRKIIFKGESEKVEIALPVSGPISTFTIKISSEIVEGELTIEVYDPTGEKQGNYTVDNQNSLKPNITKKTDKPAIKETVAGQISKSIEYPINGNWKVAIIPKNAIGYLIIESNQISIKQILDPKNKR